MTDAFDRRELLGRGARLAAGASLAAGAPWWRLAAASSPADPRLAVLQKAVAGTVLGRTSAGYDSARVLFNTVFDGVKPLGVVYCATPADVQKTVLWARKYGIRIAPRSGGHSFGGYSTTGAGVIVDVSRLHAITVDAAARTATVGAGARLFDVHQAVAAKGLAVPAGSCATVGIAGVTLGGGVGFLARKYGTTSDNLREVRLVTADGALRVCNESSNPDLFWACRGGGGGNFGIATRFTYTAHPVGGVATWIVSWPWSQARQVVAAWQKWAPHAADEMFSVLNLSAGPGFTSITAVGQLLGGSTLARSLIAPLAATGTPTRVGAIDRVYLDSVRMWAGCTSIEACHLEPAGALQRASYKVKSDYARTPLTAAGIDTLVRAMEARAAISTSGRAIVLLDSYGGAINRVGKADTAFAHRDMLFSFEPQAYWEATDPPSVVAANLAWLRSYYAAMRPYVSGEAYVNYIDPELKSWQAAYYGSNLARLARVKKAVDPQNVFRFAQSIPLAV